jgi:hypothetical protein
MALQGDPRKPTPGSPTSGFRNISLAAYQRAWAELTRSQDECGDATGSQTVTALEGARR